jgi:hypothetical protein
MLSVFFYEKYPTFAASQAGVAKLADAPDLGSGAARRVGSTPIARTKPSQRQENKKPLLSGFFV